MINMLRFLCLRYVEIFRVKSVLNVFKYGVDYVIDLKYNGRIFYEILGIC